MPHTQLGFKPQQIGLKSLGFIVMTRPFFSTMFLKIWDGEQKCQRKKEKLKRPSQTQIPSLAGPRPPHPPPVPGTRREVSPEGVLEKGTHWSHDLRSVVLLLVPSVLWEGAGLPLSRTQGTFQDLGGLQL